MKCQDCNKNYLYKIFIACLNVSNNVNDGLLMFDNICIKSGDPRNPLSISSSMYNNTCKECEKYRKYYNEYVKMMGL